ncbi:hypothetical protein DFH09DRAFT_1333786 [Mycena vulgaris]|nr:hypothetical protein DFH09DRAFT_1333786 [Mycena vulgaris]
MSFANRVPKWMVRDSRKYPTLPIHGEAGCTTALSQSDLLDVEALNPLFTNLTSLLHFHRMFLLDLEGTAERPWQEQRWGPHFREAEEEQLNIYDAYCVSYNNIQSDKIADLLAENEESLAPFIETFSGTTSPHFDELKSGVAALRRVAHRIRAGQRRAHSVQTTNLLSMRMADWKDHSPSAFGDLLLNNVFAVTTSDRVRHKYHVFLFERILLYCADAPGRHTPLAEITRTEDVPILLQWVHQSTSSLAVWREGDAGPEVFTLHFRVEAQRREWEAQLGRLINDISRLQDRIGSVLGIEDARKSLGAINTDNDIGTARIRILLQAQPAATYTRIVARLQATQAFLN